MMKGGTTMKTDFLILQRVLGRPVDEELTNDKSNFKLQVNRKSKN